MRRYWVYIISNKSRRLYTGFTDDLSRRVFEHKHKIFPNSFTAKYVYDVLVFFEEYSHFSTAKTREKEIKGWRREKKLKLILAENPDWADLSAEWREDPTWSLLPDARPRLKRGWRRSESLAYARPQRSRSLTLAKTKFGRIRHHRGLGSGWVFVEG